MPRRPINSPDYSVPVDGFSQVIAAPAGGTLLFVSGLTARLADGTIVGLGDVESQTRQVMENMRTVLKAAGASLDDVTQIRTYVLDIAQWDAIERVWADYWAGTWPASTLVQVARLFDERQLIEMDAVAVVQREVS